jgi:Ribbon-helix-helix protein, copG family
MAIAKNPVRNTPGASDRQAEAFISGAGIKANAARDQNRKPTMIRVPQDILKRIDATANRLGISRSAFIVLATAEKLERDE